MTADIQDLNPDFQSRLNAMIAASGGQLTVNSGYRSVAEQTALWNNHPDPKYVAYPGTSMHNKGLAVDLGGNLDWAHQHAAEFGLYFPMSWEPWHLQPIGIDGKSGGQMTAANTVSPASQPNTHDLGQALNAIVETIRGAPGGSAPTAGDPLTQQTEPQAQPTTTAGLPALPQKPSAAGGATIGGDLNAQLKAGFERAGRSDLAAMVGTPAFETWVNAESSGNPNEVSPANNQGKPNGGIFQFWAGHDWAQPYFQGNQFTMSPEEQAYYAATKFNLTPQRIQGFASQIQSGNYQGWG